MLLAEELVFFLAVLHDDGLIAFEGLLIAPIAGALLDRHGRVRLMIVDYVVALASLLLIGVAGAGRAAPRAAPGADRGRHVPDEHPERRGAADDLPDHGAVPALGAGQRDRLERLRGGNDPGPAAGGQPGRDPRSGGGSHRDCHPIRAVRGRPGRTAGAGQRDGLDGPAAGRRLGGRPLRVGQPDDPRPGLRAVGPEPGVGDDDDRRPCRGPREPGLRRRDGRVRVRSLRRLGDDLRVPFRPARHPRSRVDHARRADGPDGTARRTHAAGSGRPGADGAGDGPGASAAPTSPFASATFQHCRHAG